MEQNRWKSKVVWASIAAQAIALLQLVGGLQALGLDAGFVGDVVAGVLQLLVLLGVLNNPTSAKSF
jgi:uncharacterized membrane protein